jgi:hypothetical protein
METKPLFSVVLRDGERWSIEAEWPDGTIELVETFGAHFQAAEWISTYSKVWLASRAVSPQAIKLVEPDL